MDGPPVWGCPRMTELRWRARAFELPWPPPPGMESTAPARHPPIRAEAAREGAAQSTPVGSEILPEPLCFPLHPLRFLLTGPVGTLGTSEVLGSPTDMKPVYGRSRVVTFSGAHRLRIRPSRTRRPSLLHFASETMRGESPCSCEAASSISGTGRLRFLPAWGPRACEPGGLWWPGSARPRGGRPAVPMPSQGEAEFARIRGPRAARGL